MSDLLRVYLDPSEIGEDGYPWAWHRALHGQMPVEEVGPVKDLIRLLAGNRCERCGHPYQKGMHGRGEWSPCDEQCSHVGPIRMLGGEGAVVDTATRSEPGYLLANGLAEHVEAQWRILTVHHLNGVKHDCRWWNLAALCQVCHLTVQARVRMEQVYPFEHTEWFKPHAAGYYAWAYLGQDLTREETMERMDELLALELRHA